MDLPVGLGGVTLVIAAIVWLIIFVPGYTQRAQLKATTSLMRKEAREVNRNRVLTDHDRLARLLATQRGFSVLFALFLLGPHSRSHISRSRLELLVSSRRSGRFLNLEPLGFPRSCQPGSGDCKEASQVSARCPFERCQSEG
jgi:hypothetical protein